MKTIRWFIIHPKYKTSIILRGNWFFVWIFKKLMKNREVKVEKTKLKGQLADIVYCDEFI